MGAKFHPQSNHDCYRYKWGKSCNVLKITVFIKNEGFTQNSDCTLL